MKGSILKEKYSWIWLVVLMTILNLLFIGNLLLEKSFFSIKRYGYPTIFKPGELAKSYRRRHKGVVFFRGYGK